MREAPKRHDKYGVGARWAPYVTKEHPPRGGGSAYLPSALAAASQRPVTT